MVRQFLIAIVAAMTFTAQASANATAPSTAAQESYIAALKMPGHALILRHALAPGHNDPADFDLNNCSTQRNLDDVGRAQSVAIGNWLRSRDVTPEKVYTSPWCRCIETAELMDLAPVETQAGLRSFAENRSPKSETLAKLRAFMARNAASKAPLVMVTHSSTIADLIGGLVGSGEGVVVKLKPSGEIELLGRVLFGQERL